MSNIFSNKDYAWETITLSVLSTLMSLMLQSWYLWMSRTQLHEHSPCKEGIKLCSNNCNSLTSAHTVVQMDDFMNFCLNPLLNSFGFCISLLHCRWVRICTSRYQLRRRRQRNCCRWYFVTHTSNFGTNLLGDMIRACYRLLLLPSSILQNWIRNSWRIQWQAIIQQTKAIQNHPPSKADYWIVDTTKSSDCNDEWDEIIHTLFRFHVML